MIQNLTRQLILEGTKTTATCYWQSISLSCDDISVQRSGLRLWSARPDHGGPQDYFCLAVTKGGTRTELNAFHTLHSVFIRSNVVGTGREATFFSLLVSKLSFIVIMPFIIMIIIHSFRIEILPCPLSF